MGLLRDDGSDPYFSSVVSLQHFDGSDGSTTFADEIAGRTWSAVGNAQIDTAQSKFGGASLLCDGTGDRAVLTYAAAMDISSVDFTLEYFVRPAQISGGATQLDWRPSLDGRGIHMSQQSGTPNKLTWQVGDSSFSAWEFNRSSGTITADTWYHVALTRDGSTFRAFLDGVMQGSSGTFGGTIDIGTADLFLGTRRDGSAGHDGWLEEFRLTVGVARYTANFTPPTAPFPNG